MKTEVSAPRLFDEQPVTEILVPIEAGHWYERGISLAARYAEAWSVPLNLVHVRTPDVDSSLQAVQEAQQSVKARHPSIDVSGTEIDAADVATGIAGQMGRGTLVFVATDRAQRSGGSESFGEQVMNAVETMVMMAGPHVGSIEAAGSVVVALDGSVRAERSLSPALAAADGDRLWLISSVPAATTEHVAKLRERGENVSESGYLRSVAERLENASNVRWEIIHDDDPVHAVARFVETHDVRLVVATTHGETGLARRAFGSVSIGMVERLAVPVLVVKSGGTDSAPLSS